MVTTNLSFRKIKIYNNLSFLEVSIFAAPPCFVLRVSHGFLDVLAVRSSYFVSLHRCFPALRIHRKWPRTMAAWAAAAAVCQAVASARLSSLKPSIPCSTPPAATLVHRRGLAGGGSWPSFSRACFSWKLESFLKVCIERLLRKCEVILFVSISCSCTLGGCSLVLIGKPFELIYILTSSGDLLMQNTMARQRWTFGRTHWVLLNGKRNM